MTRAEEWDWPPTRGRYRHYRTIDVYQPSGWNSPGAKKAVRIYWRVTISIMAVGAFWLLWTIIGQAPP
jgi:hypothetical protein